MSINIQGSVTYKTEELMKLTKKQLISKMLDINEAMVTMIDGFKFDPTLDPYHRTNAENVQRIIHE